MKKKRFILRFILLIIAVMILVFLYNNCYMIRDINTTNGVTRQAYLIGIGGWSHEKNILYDRTSTLRNFAFRYRDDIAAEGVKYMTADKYKDYAIEYDLFETANNLGNINILDEVYGGAPSFFDVYSAIKISDGSESKWGIIEKAPSNRLKNLFLFMSDKDLYIIRKLDDQTDAYRVWKKLK